MAVARWLVLLVAGLFLLVPAAAHADETSPPPGSSPSSTASPGGTAPGSPSPSGTVDPDAPPKGPGIGVTLINSSDTSGGAKGTPVPDVRLIVLDESGKAVGEGVTDEEGRAFVPVPALGTYTVQLDESTLPSDIKLNESTKAEREVRLILSAPTFVDFPIGVTAVETDSFSVQLVDHLVSGVKFGLIVGLAALGLSLIFGTTGLTNFAHGELITFGGVMAYAINVGLGLPVIAAGVVAVLAAAALGWAQDFGLWRPLRRRGTGLIAMMIVSIGFGLFLRGIFEYTFSASTKPLNQYGAQKRVEYLGIIRLADKEIAIIAISLIVIALVSLAMLTTRMGKAMRAVSDNPALAASSGLRVDSVVTNAWVLGTALTGLSGVLLAINSQVNFQMGFKLLLLVFAAVTLGGLGTIWGALFGSMVIGLMVEVGPLFGVPSSIKEVGALIVLILILLIRPQGILGRRERIG